jgi:hypothetical protein
LLMRCESDRNCSSRFADDFSGVDIAVVLNRASEVARIMAGQSDVIQEKLE